MGEGGEGIGRTSRLDAIQSDGRQKRRRYADDVEHVVYLRTQLTHNDLTPIAYLITEPMVAVVRADSPLKTGKDLVEALRKNPASLSIALTSTGHRVSVGLPMHMAGVNIKAVRMPDVMRRSAQSDEIRQYAEQSLWLVEFKGAAETRKWLDQEAVALKLIMTELGLVRQ